MSDVDPNTASASSPWSVEAETDEADAIEQQRDLVEDPSLVDPEAPVGQADTPRPISEADEADLAEQAIEVDNEDEFDHD